jgi:hypothetical protein
MGDRKGLEAFAKKFYRAANDRFASVQPNICQWQTKGLPDGIAVAQIFPRTLLGALSSPLPHLNCRHLKFRANA